MMKLFKRSRSTNGTNHPKVDDTSIGNILVEAGLVTEEQLKAAITTQVKDPDILLGEALVHMGVLTYSQLDVILARQKLMREGATGKNIHRMSAAAGRQVNSTVDRVDAMLARLDAKKAASAG